MSPEFGDFLRKKAEVDPTTALIIETSLEQGDSVEDIVNELKIPLDKIERVVQDNPRLQEIIDPEKRGPNAA